MQVRGPQNRLCIQNLEVYSPDNVLLGKCATEELKEPWFKWELNTGEEVIGIYGHSSKPFAVSCVGIIVWKPPKFTQLTGQTPK